jgi:hypothetical protein
VAAAPGAQKQVRVDVGEGWTVGVPASFKQKINPDGSWSAWDAERTVDVHIVSTDGINGKPISAKQMLGLAGHDVHHYRRQDKAVLGYADLLQEADASGILYRLATTSAVDNRLISCWCAFRDTDKLQWALQVWDSIRNDGRPGGTTNG